MIKEILFFFQDMLIEKLTDKEMISKLFVKTQIPAAHRNKRVSHIIQIVILLAIWKRYKEVVTYIVEFFVKYIDLAEQKPELVGFVVTFVLLVLFGNLMPVIIRQILKKRDVSFLGDTFFFEYHTVHRKIFLKENRKAVRDILKIYIKCLIAAEGLFCILGQERGLSIDFLLIFYISCLCKDILDMYTCKEYEEKIKNIPDNIKEEKLKKYINRVEEETDESLILEKVFCNQFQEVQRKVEFETDEENFLYRNTQSLDHLELMQRLLNGESILTDTPFYKDMGVALFFPLQQALVQGKKIIFFSGGSESLEEITEWIRSGIRSVTKMEECWRITAFKDRDKIWDIGVITMEDLTSLYDMNKLLPEQSGVIIVFVHPERLLIDAQNELYEWGYLLSLKKIKPVYVVIERAMLGLLDLVSHIFRTEFKYVSKAATPASISALYALDAGCWEIFDQKMGMTAKSGIGSMLASFAYNENIKNVCWLAGDKKAFYDINSILLQHTSLISPNMRKVPQCQAGLWGAEIENSPFLIMEDDINNIWEMIRQAQTRGLCSSIISIVCERYLLLPFMLDNIDIFFNDLYAIPAMTAAFSEIMLNRSIILAKMLLYQGLSANEIRMYMSGYHNDNIEYNENVLRKEEEEKILEEIKKQIGEEVLFESDYNRNKNKIYTYRLKENEAFINSIEEFTAPAMYYDEEEKKQNFLGGKHLWQIDQVYLPNQIASLNGKLYRIVDWTKIYFEGKWQKVLKVRRYREGIIYSPRYYQNRKYNIVTSIKQIYENMKYGIEWGNVSVSFAVQTKGYYSISNEKRKEKIEYTELQNVIDREYTNIPVERKNGIILKISKGAEEWEQRKMIAIIFSEILKTLFPEGYHYIAVLPLPEQGNNNQDDNLNYLYYKTDLEYQPGSFHILILEDSKLELGILNMVEQHIDHILRIIYSYCKWWEKNGIANRQDTVARYVLWRSSMEKTKKFADSLEQCGIEHLAQERKKDNLINNNYISMINTSNRKQKRCLYCGGKINTDEDRCIFCSKSFLTQEVYEEMYESACWQLLILFNIEINMPVNIVIKENKNGGIIRKGSLFICDPKVQEHAARANLVRELILYWQLTNFSRWSTIPGKENLKKMRYAIAVWYELCFMKVYKYDTYVKESLDNIFNMKGKKKQQFIQLYTQYPFDNYDKMAPLKDI